MGTDTDRGTSPFDGERQKLLGDSTSSTSDYFIKPTRCHGCTYIMEPLLVLNMLITNPLLVIMPQYIERREWGKLMGNETFPANSNSCQSDANSTGDFIKGNLTLAASATSYFTLQYTLAGCLPAIVAVMFLGPFSDKAGRRYALLSPSVGQLLGALIYFLVAYFSWPMELLLVGSFIMGCSGHWYTFYSAGMSYITDLTTKENRSFRLVFAEVCTGLPAILSSAGSGYILNVLGFTWVFFILLLVTIFNLLYVIFLIPETIRRQPDVKLFSLQYIKKAITIFAVDDVTKRRWKLLLLLVNVLLFKCVFQDSTDELFVMNLPLCWGVVTVGIYSAILNGVSVVGSGVASKVLSNRLRDSWVIIICVVIGVIWSTFKYFVVTSAMMLGGAVLNFMDSMFMPTSRSLMSKLVMPDETGAVFSGVAVVQVLCDLTGSAALNTFYSATEITGHPSAVYLLVTAIEVVCLGIMVTYAILTRHDDLTKKDLERNIQVDEDAKT